MVILRAVVAASSVLLVAAATAGAAPARSVASVHADAADSAVSRGSMWGRAMEVPGTAALNKSGFAGIESVSCASAGNCSAGGHYSDASFHEQAFVVREKDGTWSRAVEVPGSAALNKYGFAGIESVSCASAGNCSAGGYYAALPNLAQSQPSQALVVNEKNGTWGKAIKVPYPVKGDPHGEHLAIASVSCVSAGDCGAGGGSFLDPSGRNQGGHAFVVSERNGTWGKAVEVPGVAALDKGGSSGITSVSCTSAGNCSAGGFYSGRRGYQVFVVTERHGTWRKAIEVPGFAALNKAPYALADLTSVSCASAGNCSAGGDYWASASRMQAFVVNQKGGTWGKAIEVPGSGSLNKGGSAEINSVSCASAGNCSGGGFYTDASGNGQAFVVIQVKGTWRTAIQVPGFAALNKGQAGGDVSSVSCASAGNCSAGGSYSDASSTSQAFVVRERNGTWGTAIEVPGYGALNTSGGSGGQTVASVSCASAGICSAGGTYDNKAGQQVFVVSEH